MVRRILFLATLSLASLGVLTAKAQFEGLPPNRVPLEDLSSFQSQAGNWSIVDSVWSDPDQSRHVAVKPGSGVLVNQPTEGEEDPLVTKWTHGDVEIELDVLMPRGSNSGIYLQGRYEVQLFDSYGVQNPTYADMGGIYQRWDPNRPNGKQGFEGHPPRVNVAKAPGLWQDLRIDFRAPRFNDEGEKVESAELSTVTLNGVVIHRNVKLDGPTRAAMFDDETASGPLVIQGDHGPVAVKNIRYKRYDPQRIELTDLKLSRYDASLDVGLKQLDTVAVAEQRSVTEISQEVVGKDDDFAARFDGTLSVPRSGKYAFDIALQWITGDPHFQDRVIGGGRLLIGGQPVVVHGGSSRTERGTIELEEGTHSFEFTYFKNRGYAPTSRANLFAEGQQMRRHALTEDTFPIGLSDPIQLEPAGDPSLIRSFLDHQGTKKTHVLSVGSPFGGHYAYDLDRGSLLRVWKGSFLRANPMWEGRGHEQRAVPLGAGPIFSGAPPVTVLSDPSAPWPDSIAASTDHEYVGYHLGPDGYPSMRYQIDGLRVTDHLRPDSLAGRLQRTVSFSGSPSGSVYFRIARSTSIRRATDNRFVVGDRAFYIEFESGGNDVMLRRSGGKDELLLPVRPEGDEAMLKYHIIW